ncbi:hypothetical protein PG593_04435 [Riemerella anatipestifer]|nr:hypothetical protein [Riemerella anatipestifer]MDY3357407.1 hypothetical protein [Riemerella anatipestifer]MDY3529023.1 hypothetical protein [Riemerella anatipestifer]
MSTLYTIVGIMFSIALGLLVTFNLQGITNKSLIIKLRENIRSVRVSYIKYFSISTFFYILEKLLKDNDKSNWCIATFKGIRLETNFSVFTMLFMIYSIVYFIINFIAMQNLNDDLYDEINLKR